MRAQSPRWNSPQARALITARDIGGLIRWARREHGWRQADLGQATGYSASAISRLETAVRPATDIDMLRRIADALQIPRQILGALLGVQPAPDTRVAMVANRRAESGEEEAMRRHALLQTGLSVPTLLLNRVDDALALMPAPTATPCRRALGARLLQGRALFDVGAHDRLVAVLPDLLATAHAVADSAGPASHALVAACYNLATETLSKIARYGTARITADRAVMFAQISGNPLAAASAARTLSIVLRHEGRQSAAQRVTLAAAANLERTGLNTPAQAAAYAQILCTCAYAAARSGDRESALEMIADAERAARRLPERGALAPSPATAPAVNPASVALYKVGVQWALGDAGAAVHTGSALNPLQFDTPERRARLHTDLARAWWAWGRPEQTAEQLLAAHEQAPAELRDRPAIRAIVTGLTAQHPRSSGVRELAAVLGHR